VALPGITLYIDLVFPFAKLVFHLLTHSPY
jgi:hypothetical protein